MTRTKRILVMVLVLVVAFAAVTGVALWAAANDPSNPAPGLYIDGRRVAEPGPALSIGTNEISFADYRHYYLVTKASIEMYYGGGAMWADDLDGERALVLRDSVETELLNLYAWQQVANELELELSEEDVASIETTLAEQEEEYGTSFERQLAAMFFDSEEDYLRITKLQRLSSNAQTAYAEKLREELADTVGAEADANYANDYISAKHILIKLDEAETDTAKADADALARSEEILAEIRLSSADLEAKFDELMLANSQDTDTEGNVNSPEGYTFKEGDMVEEFYQTAIDTPVGDVSEPVKSTFGYHIILRLPLSDDKKEENREAAISAAVTERRNAKLEEVRTVLPITPGAYYDDIKPEGII